MWGWFSVASMFDRISLILRANVNELISRFEDPEKLITQTIADAKVELAKMRESSAEVLANERRAKARLDELEAEAKKWHDIAGRAVRAGNDDDAREALAREARARDDIEAQTEIFNVAKAASDKLRGRLAEVESAIRDMEQKAALIKAKSATAAAIEAANDIASDGVSTSGGAFSAFSRMEEKADARLANAEAMSELVSGKGDDDDDLEAKYRKSSDLGVEDALAALKAEVAGE